MSQWVPDPVKWQLLQTEQQAYRVLKHLREEEQRLRKENAALLIQSFSRRYRARNYVNSLRYLRNRKIERELERLVERPSIDELKKRIDHCQEKIAGLRKLWDDMSMG